ncbi:MAG TPA: pectin acetylesterase-family hydrolase [Polyangiales bacterium]
MLHVERTGLVLVSLALALANVSCGSTTHPAAQADSGAQQQDSGTACPQGMVFVGGKCVSATSGWTRVSPGGETTCARGAPYSFFVHVGKTNKVLMYFAFGGFCFNAELCKVGATNLVPAVDVDEQKLAALGGIFDLTRADNPFRDWSMVYVPECTGDFETGNNVMDYPALNGSPAITVHHKGFVNVTAVREWTYKNFVSPERMFITGSSGGGDAALMHYPYLRKHYENVKNWTCLLDASFGVTTDSFLTTGSAGWKAYANRPSWIPAIQNATPIQLTQNLAEIEGQKHYGSGVLAELGTAYDTLESITYQLMGGDMTQWHDKMEAHLKDVSTAVPESFRSFILSGTDHIILNQATFYQYSEGGVSVRDWVADLAAGKDVNNVQCDAATKNCMVVRLK